ncbi:MULTISPECIES: AGE family epimerase/isomerase [unclassified Microbulbifer]|uniref:AGE family epimerase/isomerase n=1 Tax=unclassified Microbulbifer TaxID=2619833 RepID=UPI0027E52E82|nr:MULTISPECIES: AGE family epimerase/isomerase [unclassified Microbulbifer]
MDIPPIKDSLATGLPGPAFCAELQEEFSRQLLSIADWWLENALDRNLGGFFGEVSVRGTPDLQADKGVVLNARILWFFSELCLYLENPEYIAKYRHLADRAFRYFVERFDDKVHGGAVWSVDYQGKIVDGTKKTYAQAFSIYALSSYYRLSNNRLALDKALSYFELIEKNCVDRELGGYWEAVGRDWLPIEDVRLSDKDMNAPKTMNNHLHVMEAYTGLFRASKKREVESALTNSIQWFCEKILDKKSGHLRLFLNRDWTDISTSFSYGHDIEASWLLAEALEDLGNPHLQSEFSPCIHTLSGSCLREGIGELGQVLDTYDFSLQTRHTDSEWWVQAEALVGFLNAWQSTGEERYWKAFLRVWQFVKDHQIDWEDGEWLYHSTLDRPKEEQNYKAGFWKGPYHNGRAMMEVCRRIKNLSLSGNKNRADRNYEIAD